MPTQASSVSLMASVNSVNLWYSRVSFYNNIVLVLLSSASFQSSGKAAMFSVNCSKFKLRVKSGLRLAKVFYVYKCSRWSEGKRPPEERVHTLCHTHIHTHPHTHTHTRRSRGNPCVGRLVAAASDRSVPERDQISNRKYSRRRARTETRTDRNDNKPGVEAGLRDHPPSEPSLVMTCFGQHRPLDVASNYCCCSSSDTFVVPDDLNAVPK